LLNRRKTTQTSQTAKFVYQQIMSNDEIHLEDKNAVGGLDRLVTNVSLAIVAAFPTFAICIVKPWKLVPQLTADEPDGRQGYLLSPGAYFPIGLTIMLLIASALTNEETLAGNGGVVGPRMAVDIAEAAAAGNVWKTVSILAPLYFIAIIAGVVGKGLTRWVGPWWTLRTSMRAAFYQMTTSISWIILSSAAIDLIGAWTDIPGLWRILYTLNTIPIFGIALWMYFWFFKRGGNHSTLRASVLAVAMLIFIIAFVSGTNVILASIG
jgi:hypothetical protein